MGKIRNGRAPWTEREDALICRWRQRTSDLDEIAAKLPHRTPIAVKRRFSHLIHIGRIASLRAGWTREEDDLICALRAKRMSAEAIARHLPHRTIAAVTQRTQQLRLDRAIGGQPVVPTVHRPWTDREESVLVRLRARDAPISEIKAKLPHRTHRAIETRISVLLEADELERSVRATRSSRPWSPEEDALVAAMRAAKKTEQQMAAALARSLPSVKSRIAQRVKKGELGLVRPIVNRRG